MDKVHVINEDYRHYVKRKKHIENKKTAGILFIIGILGVLGFLFSLLALYGGFEMPFYPLLLLAVFSIICLWLGVRLSNKK